MTLYARPMAKAIGESFGALFPVVNPIGVVPIFLSATRASTRSAASSDCS